MKFTPKYVTYFFSTLLQSYNSVTKHDMPPPEALSYCSVTNESELGLPGSGVKASTGFSSVFSLMSSSDIWALQATI